MAGARVGLAVAAADGVAALGALARDLDADAGGIGRAAEGAGLVLAEQGSRTRRPCSRRGRCTAELARERIIELRAVGE